MKVPALVKQHSDQFAQGFTVQLDKSQLIKLLSSVLPLFILMCPDVLFQPDLDLLTRVLNTLVLLIALILSYQFVFVSLSIHSLKHQLLRVLLLGSILFSAHMIVGGYAPLEDILLNITLVYSWFSLVDLISVKYSSDKIYAKFWMLSIAMGLGYLVWIETFKAYETGFAGIYSSFFDFTVLSILLIVGVDGYQKIINYLRSAYMPQMPSLVLGSCILLLLVVLVYEPYLRFVHQTSLVRYELFWSEELPLLLGGILILNIHFIYSNKWAFGDKIAHLEEIIIKQTKKDFLLRTEDIAYVNIQNSITVVQTHDRSKYVLDKTLNELEEELNPNQFFRANRQLILSMKSILDYRKDVNQKVVVVYQNASCEQEETIISRYRSPKFKRWFRNMECLS